MSYEQLFDAPPHKKMTIQTVLLSCEDEIYLPGAGTERRELRLLRCL